MALEKIYEKAKEAAVANEKEIKELKELEEKANLSPEEKIRIDAGEKAEWKIINGTPDIKTVVSEELFKIVKELNFNIIEYAKRTNVDTWHEYEPVLEYYSVEYNNYKFIIRNLHDCDIEEGIFAVYGVTNKLNNEYTKFFLDLGCRNTCSVKKHDFLLLLNSENEHEYLIKKYDIYNRIPELLKNNGCDILENKLEFCSDKIKGFIKVDENIYVIPYFAGRDEVRVVISNINSWDVNSSNRGNKIGYYIEYNDASDIKNIITAIDAMKKHVDGKFGYLEDGVFYKNRDIEKILDINSRRDERGCWLDAVNHYRIRINKVNQWDARGYGKHRYISVLDGLEMAVHFALIINDSAQWSEGDIINYSDIVFKYDKNIDDENCILLIKNYQYHQDENIHVPSDEDYVFEEIDLPFSDLNEEYFIDSVELRGSFTELREKLIDYMNNMCEINNIDFKF